MKSTLFIVAALLLPCLAVAQQTPCQESAKPILEESRMAVQNGEGAKAKEAAQRYGETVAKCDAAVIEAARRAADIAATTQFVTQFAAQVANEFSRQTGGQEK